MSPIIHAELGWLVAQPLARRRDRLLVTAVAVLPDLDGLTLLAGEEAYSDWHHKVAHGLWAAVLMTLAVALLARSWRATVLAAVAFHVHVLADLVGSGPQWPLFYWWPLSDSGWLPSWQWDLASWQNTVIGLAVTLFALGFAVWRGRTPVELFSLRADRHVVDAVRTRLGRAPPL